MTGPELATWRHNHSLTQAKLAAALGCSTWAVKKWEQGLRALPPYLGLALKTVEREGVRE